MVSFKLISLCMPYLFMEELMQTAEEEEMNLLYKKAK